VYDNGERRVTFDDVAGNDEVVAELREVVEFLRTPEKFQRIGGRIPKGVLLVGPPGTGKTLLAKAVAGEAGVPFFSLSGSDFVEMFVGVGAARVRSLFAQANAKAPCLIFIDELDALGKARGSGGPGNHDERDQTLNQLLVEMDGFDSNRGIILIAATNRPETLDAALVRPGRFDRQVVVDRPDITGREDILRVHVRTVALDDGINLRQIAAMTPGFVGADLANLVNEAALLAARKGKPSVGSVEFQEGVERVIAGPEKKQRVIRDEEKLRIAYHEAGHALVARSLPNTDPVHKVSILGRGNGALGYTMSLPESDRFLHTRSWLEDTIRTLLGGTVAEEIVYGEVSDGATSDLQRATSIARRMVAEFGMSPRLGRVSYQTEGRSPFLAGGGANDYAWSEQTAREIDLEVRRVVEENLEVTRQILTRRRDALEGLARSLIERESIDADELRQILDRYPDVPSAA
jgi:cell division protease FtsH